MFKTRQFKTYPIRRSPLWRLRSQKKFAYLLGLPKTRFKKLVTEREYLYRAWTEVIDGKERHLAVPTGPMRRVHERLKNLIDRIEKPSYLFSPKKGHSPTMNAALHVGAGEAFKIDVKKFYPSTTREHVFRFCFYGLEMSHDVAGAFAKLATFEGRVPFGSPLSPTLCAHVHKDMYDGIQTEVQQDGAKFSVWVDDLTVSAKQISGLLAHKIRRSIKRKGFGYHKEERKNLAKGIVVTGTFVSQRGIAPSNKQHTKMRDRLAELDKTKDLREQEKIVRSLIGMAAQAQRNYSLKNAARARIIKLQQWLHHKRRQLDVGITKNINLENSKKFIPESNFIPWDE